MTLLQIKYLTAVGETGNVSKAANELFVSRQTISRSLRELEEEFSIPLFYRTNTGLVLTHEGRFLYERSIEIQRMSDALTALMRRIREKRSAAGNIVKIGVSPITSLLVFPKLYRQVCRQLPEVRIITKEYSFIHSLTALEEGSIDFNLTLKIRDTMLPQGLERLELFKTQLVLCVASGHRLASREYVTVDDIRNEPLIYLNKFFQVEDSIEILFTKNGYFPNIRFRSLQLSTVKELTASGIGSAILARGAIDDGKRIIGIPLSPEIPGVISIVWNPEVQHDAAFYSFLGFVREFKDSFK